MSVGLSSSCCLTALDCRIVALLANMIVLSPYATQDLATMARHHAVYDHVGLAELAEQTTTSTFIGLPIVVRIIF